MIRSHFTRLDPQRCRSHRQVNRRQDCVVLRAGLSSAWIIGDKTGTGAKGAVNDLLVAWSIERRYAKDMFRRCGLQKQLCPRSDASFARPTGQFLALIEQRAVVEVSIRQYRDAQIFCQEQHALLRTAMRDRIGADLEMLARATRLKPTASAQGPGAWGPG